VIVITTYTIDPKTTRQTKAVVTGLNVTKVQLVYLAVDGGRETSLKV